MCLATTIVDTELYNGGVYEPDTNYNSNSSSTAIADTTDSNAIILTEKVYLLPQRVAWRVRTRSVSGPVLTFATLIVHICVGTAVRRWTLLSEIQPLGLLLPLGVPGISSTANVTVHSHSLCVYIICGCSICGSLLVLPSQQQLVRNLFVMMEGKYCLLSESDSRSIDANDCHLIDDINGYTTTASLNLSSDVLSKCCL